MNRRISLALAFGVALLVPWGTARATIDVPSPANSTAPTHLSVMGLSSLGGPDFYSEILVEVRGYANELMVGSVVMIDFSGCADARLCSDPHDSNAIVNCAGRTVAKVTNVSGQARFRFVGSSVGGAGAIAPCARIYADGVLLRSPSVAIFDLTGNDGLSPQDLGLWLDDFFSGHAPAREDYDGDGAVGPGDLSLWLQAYFASGSVTNCGNAGLCP